LEVSYLDAVDSSGSTITIDLIDPYGLVFNSETGDLINDVVVSLYDASTGNLAAVYGDDGVSTYPSTVTTGGSVTDSSGKVYDFGQGAYRFPLVAPGNYYLVLDPPDLPLAYGWPSIKTNAQLVGLANGPFVVNLGSRGETFPVPAGPPVRLDLPIDPYYSDLHVRRTASKDVVAAGDFLEFNVIIEHTGVAVLQGAVLTDQLPKGFRFQANSARLDGVQIGDPQLGSDGRTLTFNLGDIAADTTVTVSYVASVGAVRAGEATSSSVARGNLNTVVSNTATLVTKIKEDFMRSHDILIGRVAVMDDNGKPGKFGLAGVRIFMEDGTYVLTDDKGRFHFEGVKAGTHVVQLDLDSLPAGYQVVDYEKNTRYAGRAWSQFVDLKGGALWRVNFYVRGPDTASIEKPDHESASKEAGSEKADIYDESWLQTAAPGIEWLSPVENALPKIPSVTVAVKHHRDTTLKLYLNGQPVKDENFDGTATNKQGVALSRWSGVDLTDGNNSFEAVITDAGGNQLARISRTVHYSLPPIKFRPASVPWVSTDSTRLIGQQERNELRPQFCRVLPAKNLPIRLAITVWLCWNLPRPQPAVRFG
jgi:uncharacterized repeat protein (TIGR01451 family)